MRVLAIVVALLGGVASAATVWNARAKVADGSYKKLVLLDEKPQVVLPACRCVAGVWKASGETATHFTGALRDASFNHRRARPLGAIQIRKTRPLMGVHRDYREALHAILRGSGQLVLREVEGGEWEVVGYAPEPLGELFANNPSWSARGAAEPGEPTPLVDPDADAAALAKLVNDYRASLGLPRVPLSPALTKVARAHVRDLNANPPAESCSLHSWSSHGAWSACCYDGSKEAARCMWVKPKEIARYRGAGYEIAANASGITPERALELWQHSPAHHDVVANRGKWTAPWKAMGVAIEGDHAVAWFGELAR